MEDNPWLHIPAEDYEAHMAAIGQSTALRELFARVYSAVCPAHLAILGCTTGSDLGEIEPAITSTIVGVDINSEYLAIARRRWSTLGSRLRWIHADVLEAELPPLQFNLVHAALVLEYVEPDTLFRRIFQWLAPLRDRAEPSPPPGLRSESCDQAAQWAGFFWGALTSASRRPHSALL